MAVYYKCKVCGQEYKSPIAFADKKLYESSKLVNNAFQYPKTGKLQLHTVVLVSGIFQPYVTLTPPVI